MLTVFPVLPIRLWVRGKTSNCWAFKRKVEASNRKIKTLLKRGLTIITQFTKNRITTA
jgi:hypothetical protein